MTQYNILNVKLSNSPINKLKSGMKNGTQVTLNFHQMLLVILTIRLIFRINIHILLTNRQILRLFKAFVNNSSANIKLSKT